jgi:hypothetical protein
MRKNITLLCLHSDEKKYLINQFHPANGIWDRQNSSDDVLVGVASLAAQGEDKSGYPSLPMQLGGHPCLAGGALSWKYTAEYGSKQTGEKPWRPHPGEVVLQGPGCESVWITTKWMRVTFKWSTNGL